ncbi:DUF192 domain-containing protein [Kiloniella antarctica]|uniref:DUF192 domain-containing protein n=1 Tax=Kiloniella antarctica TaxID=1550907 RepID=A0ABW5BMM8_9PROT
MSTAIELRNFSRMYGAYLNRYFLPFIVIWSTLFFVPGSVFSQDLFKKDTLTIFTLKGAAHKFDIELAVTPEQKSQGLMHRKKMPLDAGMLFVYEDENDVMMWMKNTYLPLDMLFLNSEGKIVYIEENTTPLSTRTISSGRNVIGVLELNAGTALRLGIKAGDIANHHLLQQ